MRRSTSTLSLAAVVLLTVPLVTTPASAGPLDPWTRHDIVPGSAGTGNFDGSDGVAIADINEDGHPDVVSGYEQGHRVSLSLNPGPNNVTGTWERVTLPGNNLEGPEDAVFGDVDSDGVLDIIVGAEGHRRVVVLFAPSTEKEDLLDASAWTRMDIQASVTLLQKTMRVQLADMDGDFQPDILVGGKEDDSHAASLGYYSSSTPRTATSWTYHSITPVAWVMQMEAVHMDGDGDLDIVYSDRDPIDEPDLEEPDRSRMGLRWLESSGGTSPSWTAHPISPVTGSVGERYHKWFSRFNWNGDSELDIVECRSNIDLTPDNELSIWLNGGGAASWTELSVPVPSGIGNCQHMSALDVDEDGTDDLAFTAADAGDLTGNPDTKSGLVWLKNTGTPESPTWVRNEIGGLEEGIKYDNLIWYDLDGDGDQDAITSEQHENVDTDLDLGPGLGVVWYENPTF